MLLACPLVKIGVVTHAGSLAGVLKLTKIRTNTENKNTVMDYYTLLVSILSHKVTVKENRFVATHLNILIMKKCALVYRIWMEMDSWTAVKSLVKVTLVVL